MNSKASTADGVRQKFTQKERDIETGLDYFGARYYASTQGRFTSVDPANITGRHVVNPQRWNLYVYVNNNPLALFDPDGRDPQGKAGRTIDIFLTFKPTDREYTKTRKGRVYDKGPDYDGLQERGRKAGFNVVVHDLSGSTTTAVTNSLQTAEVTSIVGHGSGPTMGGKFTAVAVSLNGGEIGPGGVRTTTTNASGTITPVGPKTNPPVDNNIVTGLFTCNSADQLPKAFDTANLLTNQSMVVNTGGNNGLTTVGTLENANYAFVDTYIKTNGNVQTSAAAAQRVVDASTLPDNRDGDKIKKVP